MDYLALHAARPLVVRHNGGSQSGHTVEQRGPGGKRFVFHGLSSGSLRGADTLWLDSFHPDLYKLGPLGRDRTNEPNEWQGRLRYARHESEEAFVAELRKDLLRSGAEGVKARLFLTHLNETGGCVVLQDGALPVEDFLRLPKLRESFRGCYLSASPYSEDVSVLSMD